MQPERLLKTAVQYKEASVVQRLGYLLEFVLEESELNGVLHNYLKNIEYYPTLLRPQKEKSKNKITGNP